jgi:hypothetical protein
MISGVGRLLARILRLLLLAPLLATGCFTILTWQAAPELRPARLLGADLDDHGELSLRVELSDGSRHSYRGIQGKGVSVDMTPLEDHGASGSHHWRFLPMREDGRIELPGTYAGSPDGKPVVVAIGPPPEAQIEVADIDGVPIRAYLHLPEDGNPDWSHPGTWLCVVATPVTVAVDAVLLPLQLLFFFVLRPEC